MRFYLIDSKDFTIALLNHLQLPQKIPKRNQQIQNSEQKISNTKSTNQRAISVIIKICNCSKLIKYNKECSDWGFLQRGMEENQGEEKIRLGVFTHTTENAGKDTNRGKSKRGREEETNRGKDPETPNLCF